MRKKEKTKKTWRKKLRHFVNNYTGLVIIAGAALLIELMTGIIFYLAQNYIQGSMEMLEQREMNAIYLCIRNKLASVEVTMDNMAWVVSEGLDEPDWMFDIANRMVKNNPSFWGSGVAFKPNYYPKKGKFFEPYSVRRGEDSIVSMQVGNIGEDHTQKEYFRIPVTEGKSHWSEPYLDLIGAQGVITTYSVPVRDQKSDIVGVVFADITIDWLEDIMTEAIYYKTTQRFLVSGRCHRLAGKDIPLIHEILKEVKKHMGENYYYTLTDENNEKQHVFITPVGGKTDWMLINVVEDNDVFGRLRKMRLLLLLPAMIGLLLAGFIVWRSSRNLERLRKINAEKARTDSELKVANQIQQSMLPKEYLHHDFVDICGSLVPARQVGGDLFDYLIRDEKLFFCIGDVSGKGAPAAMLMAVTHGLFRSAAARDSNPARIMQNINEVSCQSNEAGMFVTMFIGVLDLPTGHLRYCDAGHDAPFIMNNGQLSMLDVDPHLPVGVFDDTKYVVQELEIQPESTLFLYTDGLTEAKNAERKQFGLERVKPVLTTCANKEPAEILDTVTEAVDGFVKDAEPSDDLTMLAIHYSPKQFESTMTETLVLKNDVREVTRFSSFMKTVFEKLDIEKSLSRQLRLAVEEAVVNVINYAYPPDTEGEVTVTLMSNDQALRFQIIDAGVAFDPTEQEKADTTLSAEERRIGGLGIYLVRELMDTINYERQDGKNILTLIKNIK